MTKTKSNMTFDLVLIPVANMVHLADWQRNKATTSHLLDIESWYGNTEASYIIVRELGDKFEILAGNCRFARMVELEKPSIMVRVVSGYSEVELADLKKNKVARGLDKDEVYKLLVQALKGRTGVEAWIESIKHVGLDLVSLAFMPKSGTQEMKKPEQITFTNYRTAGKMPYDEAIIKTFLSTRWTGLKQSVNAIAKASPVVQEFFANGRLTRSKSMLEKLPDSCVTETTNKNEKGKITYSHVIDFKDPELVKLATEKEKHAENFKGNYFIPASKLAPVADNSLANVADLEDIDLDFTAGLGFIVNEKNDELSGQLYEILLTTEQGRAFLELLKLEITA